VLGMRQGEARTSAVPLLRVQCVAKVRRPSWQRD
jgi:hypothetical protein